MMVGFLAAFDWSAASTRVPAAAKAPMVSIKKRNASPAFEAETSTSDTLVELR